MDVSCHSFVRMAKLAAPLMTDGGTMFAMSYVGANRVVANYNVMGPVKAALEAACRYLAYELGPQQIRVHAISPGPLKTRASSGIKDFELLLNQAAAESPLGQLVDIDDVGHACAYLATPWAHRITGGTIYIDGGRQHHRLGKTTFLHEPYMVHSSRLATKESQHACYRTCRLHHPGRDHCNRSLDQPRPAGLALRHVHRCCSAPCRSGSSPRSVPPGRSAMAAGMSAYLNALPEPLYALFGTGYLGYTAARQWGKVRGVDR